MSDDEGPPSSYTPEGGIPYDDDMESIERPVGYDVWAKKKWLFSALTWGGFKSLVSVGSQEIWLSFGGGC